MENNRRPIRSITSVLCKKHPKHRQSPGVCSICLREKLSQISSSSSRSTTAVHASSSTSSSLSSLSSQYSSDASSCSSPVRPIGRMASEARGGSSSLSTFLMRKDNYVLTKSRSMAFIARRREQGDVKDQFGKKKSGFWSKFMLRSRSRKMEEGLKHSRTMRERPLARAQ